MEEQTTQGIDLSVFLHNFRRTLQHFFWVPIVLGLLLGGVSWLRAARSYAPVYQSSAVFSVSAGFSSSTDILSHSTYLDSNAAAQLSATFPYVLQSDRMQLLLQQELGDQRAPVSLSASSVADAALFTLTATGSDPQAVYDTLLAAIEVYPAAATTILGDTQIQVIDQPIEPSAAPINANTALQTGIRRGVVGLVLGLVLVALLSLTRRTVHSAEDLHRLISLSCLSSIPAVRRGKRTRREAPSLLLTHAGTGSDFSEAMRNLSLKLQRITSKHGAKVVLITSTVPGEGKTTVSVGLADGMTKIGKKAMLALREPSLGPVFGMKGGAAGGGRAQVLPMEQINLHFTGDLHAITAANNLLAAMVDNHIQQGNALGIDPRQVTWRRCLDVNDRQLRAIVSGLGGKPNGNPREDGFDITAASEVMAVFCLAKDLQDLKARLSRLQVARTYSGKPVTAGDLHAAGAMTALLRDALQPNLVQTIDGTPCLMHGGPFANIAHGCNSVIATTTAMRLADYVVTEAGFGADLGAEKFMDIKCRMSGIFPDAVVLVATVRALKSHGGCPKADLSHENVEALRKGLPNLLAHIDHIRNVWKRPVVVALNRFVSDTEAEMALLRQACADAGAPVELCDGWAKGGDGVKELAARVCGIVDSAPKSEPCYTYDITLPLKDKIEAIATRIYGAAKVEFAGSVLTQLQKLEDEGWRECPVCIAKTQYSFSDDAKLLGAPVGHTLHIRQVRLNAGAGFVVAFAGDIIAMPGLPKVPAAEAIDVDENGEIVGLF